MSAVVVSAAPLRGGKALSGHSHWVKAAMKLQGGAKKKDSSVSTKKKKKKQKEEEVVEEIAEEPAPDPAPRRRRRKKSSRRELEETASVNELDASSVVYESDGSVLFLTEEELERMMLAEGDIVRLHGPRRKTTLARVAEGDANGVSEAVSVNLGGSASSLSVAGPLTDVEDAASIVVSPTGGEEEGEIDFDEAFEELKPHLSQGRALKKGDYLDAAKRWIVTELDEGLDEATTGPDTDVQIGAPSVSGDDEDEERRASYDDIGGCSTHVETLREILDLPLHSPHVFSGLGVPPPKGALIFGPAGCGKTTLARAAAYESGAHVEIISGSEITSKKSGEAEEALRAKFAAAEARAPAVIFIDEIESVGKKRDKASSENDKRVTSQLLTLMDGLRPSSGVVVLAATSRPNDLDPALRRFGRLDREIELLVPDEKDRLEILKVKTRHVSLCPDVDLKAIADECHGFVGADISQLCTEAALMCVKDAVNKRQAALLKKKAGGEATEVDIPSEEDVEAALDLISTELLDENSKARAMLRVRHDHFLRALKTCNPSSLRESAVEVPDVTWMDVGGLEDVKLELKETVEYPVQFATLYQDFGLPPSRGVLFYGPPGCGKTLIAKAVANECGANFISVKGPELLTMWFGQSEANVRSLFDKARAAAPCVLFFDEMDSIAKARSASASSSDAGDRVMNQILAEIDAIGSKNVFVVGATNRPDILDPAVTRPGRLDQLVQIPLPDLDSRRSVFRASLRKAPVEDAVDLDQLARATQGFSGADIAEICQRAAKNAVKAAVDAEISGEGTVSRIEKRHFEDSMARARRSVPQSEVDRYSKFAKSLKTSAKSGADQAFSFERGFYSPEEALPPPSSSS